jgi:TonB family protein
MNRLRVRVELNRRKAGVPLNEMIGVVEEVRKFFLLLAADVEIDHDRGEWLASDFDPESLNFTVEYGGPATADQIREFGAAFCGSTSLRQETIAQFTHIADHIGEDELVGFGLYTSDQDSQPSDWRCLSRRDALRFAGEIQLLAKAAGESVSPLSSFMNGSVGGRRLFKDHRERERIVADPARKVIEVESVLTKRITLLEDQLHAQTNRIDRLHASAKTADERALQLITAMQSAWTKAPRLLQQAPNAPCDVATSNRNSHEIEETERTSLGTAQRQATRIHLIVIFLLVAAIAALSCVVLILGTTQFSRPRASLGLTGKGGTPFIAGPNQLIPQSGEVEAGLSAGVPRVRINFPLGPTAGTQAIPLIALEVPPELKRSLRSEARVSVAVTVDEQGKVTDARVLEARGERADLLIPASLRAARGLRFRPGVEEKQVGESRSTLTFIFEPK